jgi:hypothetical protein
MKKALWIVAAILLVIAGGVFWAYYSVDLIVKFAVEHYAPEIAGVPVKIGDVHISPRDGRGRIGDVEIGNPQGFGSPRAAKLGEISVWLDPLTLADPVVYIRELTIEAPLITYEKGDKGTNLEAIQKRIEGYVKESASSGGATAAGGNPIRHKFIVGKLTIRGAKVTMTNPRLKGQGITFDLPDIQLRDLGKGENGLTASQLANVVASTLISKIAQRLLTNIELLRQGGVEGAIDALKSLVR